MLHRALVEFDLVGASSLFVGQWCGHADTDGGRVAAGTRRIVDPAEERSLEPSHQCSDDAVLVAPGGLLATAQAFRFSLEDLAFFFGFVVDLLKRHYPQGLIQQSGVLPPHRHVGERVQHVPESKGARVLRGLGDQGYVSE